MKKHIAILDEAGLSQFYMLGSLTSQGDDQLVITRVSADLIESGDTQGYDHILTARFDTLGHLGYEYNPVNHVHTFIRHPKPLQQEIINYRLKTVKLASVDERVLFKPTVSSRVSFTHGDNYVQYHSDLDGIDVIIKPIAGARSLGVIHVPAKVNLRWFLIQLRKLVTRKGVVDRDLVELCEINGVKLFEAETRSDDEHCETLADGMMLQEFIPKIKIEYRVIQFGKEFIILARDNKEGSTELNRIVTPTPHMTTLLVQLRSLGLQEHGSYDLADIGDGIYHILEYQPQYGHNYVPTKLHQQCMTKYLLSLGG